MTDDTLYVLHEDGRLHFTAHGRETITPYFARAGISIDSIKSWDDYQGALSAAAPFLDAYIQRLAKPDASGDASLERDLLQAIVEGDGTKVERIKRQLKTRERLRVVPGNK